MRVRNRGRSWLLGGGLMVGAVSSAFVPTGCIIPDYCIMIIAPGRDWCTNLEGAMMWPVGKPEEAEPVVAEHGGPIPGCVCFNEAEQSIIALKVPAGKAQELEAELKEVARNECHLLVPLGYDHTCYIDSGPDAPAFSLPYSDDPSDDCYGSCKYVNPPPTKGCPEDPNPFECNGEDGGNDEVEGESEDDGSDTDTSDDTGTDTDSDTGDILAPSEFIDCRGTACDIDDAFARSLWTDPSLLALDETRLVYDATATRFVFASVWPGSVAHELGLRSGDVLESIDRLVIDDVDAAFDAYIAAEHATNMSVRVMRDTQWIDFTYTFVP